MTLDRVLKLIAARIDALELIREPRGLYQPVAYCLKNGGKRMRPAMTLLACSLFGGDPQKAMNAAIGLELFHNFTLMHDDIMDNAPIRRGMPAVHAKWDVNTAILSGDVMFALACEYIMKVEDARLREVMEVFYGTVRGVCEGQQLDMDFERRSEVSLNEYMEMIRLKTAVLPAACLKIGAIIAGADTHDQEHISRFGAYIGLAFQLKDDWLDLFGNEARFGKKTGGDILANKKTWLYIRALELAGDARRKALLAAYQNHIADPDEKINTVKNIFLDLDVDRLIIRQMEELYEQAFTHLDRIAQPEARKTGLRDLANSMFDRQS